MSVPRIVAAVAAPLLAAGPAAAAALQGFGGDCTGGCAFSYSPQHDDGLGPGSYVADYTVLADGRVHIWTFRFTRADATSTLYLTNPTQTDEFIETRAAGGGTDFAYDGNPPYTFGETIVPGELLRITSSGPRDFDYCTSRTGPVGQVCSRTYQIFGNGTFLVAGGDTVIDGVFTENVPEPKVWAMLVAGFGLVGTALRRRRAVA